MDAQDFTREELQALWGRASQRQVEVLNPVWQKAYEEFAWACCILDAFMARSTGLDAGGA